jgi:hypothetical protein
LEVATTSIPQLGSNGANSRIEHDKLPDRLGNCDNLQQGNLKR